MDVRGSGSRPLNQSETSDHFRQKRFIGPLAETGPNVEKIITDIIMSYVSPSVRFLDIACRTGTHLVPLCSRIMHGLLAGVDPSRDHVRAAKKSIAACNRAVIVRASGFTLPFRNNLFNIITCRMSAVSIREVFRVLDTNGWFIHKGPGPEYNAEIKEVFRSRYVFNPYEKFAGQNWKSLFGDNARKLGFDYFHVDEYLCYAYYNPEGLIEYLETVPVVENFEREKDRNAISAIMEKHTTDKGIRISRQLYLMRSRK